MFNPKPETRNPKRRYGGQTILEYALLLGMVTVAIIGMQTYAGRGIKAVVMMAADRVGDQREGLQEIDPEQGFIQKENQDIRTTTTARIQRTALSDGATKRETVFDRSDTTTAHDSRTVLPDF